MPRKSTKEDKSIYFQAREEAGLTREQAAEKLQFISDGVLEKIEYGTREIQPEEVLAMAEAYGKPSLCNHYCSHDCPIGQEHVPEIKSASLSQIVLAMLASLNSLNKEKDRLIEITADGVIDDEELPDFARIEKQLDSISRTVDSLKLWVADTKASGAINTEKLDRLLNE